MHVLRQRGIGFGAITVLARHTCPAVREIHDFWAGWGVDIRLLPLFAGPSTREMARFEVCEAELVEAFGVLFDHWIESDARIRVSPLDEWLTAVVRQMLGIEAGGYDRRRDGESVLVVRPNGDVYQTNEVGNQALALGNLANGDIEQLLRGRAYAASLDRSEALTTTICGGCDYAAGCDHYPAHAETYALVKGRRCPVAFQVYQRIAKTLRRKGFGKAELHAIAEGLADAQQPA
jgi:radical SAM protein with 4Fe4S-binding SPASM domain